MPPICISVPRRLGEKARRLLAEHDLLDTGYRIVSFNEYLIIPIVDAEEAAEILSRHGIQVATVDCNPPPRKHAPSIQPPSYDIIGGRVAIVREKVLENTKPSVIVEMLRRLHPRLESILVKTGTAGIERRGVYRLLWGRPVERIVAKEHGLLITVDIARTYYNPRLSTEHRRVAEMTRDWERVLDMFTGVGGFALHIASMRRSLVVANDINVYALECLVESLGLNRKKLMGDVVVAGIDAAYADKVFAPESFDRIIANLPHGSLRYMRVYERLLRRRGILHLYVLAADPESLSPAGWRLLGYREVLEYSPGLSIYRLDLEKP